jgi:hypothetical protein
MLTGSKHQYVIIRDPKTMLYTCSGWLNANTKKWEAIANSPHDGFSGSWPMQWPETGKPTPSKPHATEDELFKQMCVWEANNFIIGAGAKAARCSSLSGCERPLATNLCRGEGGTVLGFR